LNFFSSSTLETYFNSRTSSYGVDEAIFGEALKP
jgi:hypothetical protein